MAATSPEIHLHANDRPPHLHVIKEASRLLPAFKNRRRNSCRGSHLSSAVGCVDQGCIVGLGGVSVGTRHLLFDFFLFLFAFPVSSVISCCSGGSCRCWSRSLPPSCYAPRPSPILRPRSGCPFPSPCLPRPLPADRGRPLCICFCRHPLRATGRCDDARPLGSAHSPAPAAGLSLQSENRSSAPAACSRPSPAPNATGPAHQP